MEEIKNYIGGEFVSGLKTRDVFKPATEQVYAQVPASESLEVIQAVVAAKKAGSKWANTSHVKRADLLNKLADKMEAHQEELALAESIDVGKPLWLATKGDIPRAIQNFRHFASQVVGHTGRASVAEQGSINYELRPPVGVCAVITPWNLPLYILTWRLAPALAWGNTVVCKPSELTPKTAFMLSQFMHEVGFPKGVCNFVYGTGPEAGVPLVSHPGVNAVAFTGGTETGSFVASEASKHLKKVNMELGGKNANIIFKDADLEKALNVTLKSSFLNQGQICLSGSRVFIQEPIYNEFVQELVKRTKALKVGDPLKTDTFMGPLVSKEHLEKVRSCLVQAQKDKGVLLTGDEPLELDQGYFMRPVVIENLSECSELHHTEIFGPVVTVEPFKYPKDPVRRSNTCGYGLSASIWTQNINRAHKVAAQLEVGTVWINTWMERDVRMPFGGVKNSGIGRASGLDSMEFFTESKTVCVSVS